MDTEALKKSLLTKFVEVTQDRLQKIQLGVLEIEKPGASAAVESVARELHTMKGESRMLGLAAIGQLAHACEDLLKAWRDGKFDARVCTDTLLHGCDAIADLLDDLDGAKAGTPASGEIAARLSQTSGTALPPLKPGGLRPPITRPPQQASKSAPIAPPARAGLPG